MTRAPGRTHRGAGWPKALTVVVAAAICLFTIFWFWFSQALGIAARENVQPSEVSSWAEDRGAWQWDALHIITILGGGALLAAILLASSGRRRQALIGVGLFVGLAGLWTLGHLAAAP